MPIDYASRDGRVAADDFFVAEQNARLVTDAEEYYRECFGPRIILESPRPSHG